DSRASDIFSLSLTTLFRSFHIFLTLILSLEKAIRAGFSYSDELRPLTLLALTRVENILNDYESPVADLFKEDLTNLKFTLENYRSEEHTSELQSREHLVCR